MQGWNHLRTPNLTNKLKLGQRGCVSVSFHLPTVVIRRSGWSCRNMNWLQSEVISHSTSSRLITVSASCRTYRGLQQTGVGHMEDAVWVLVREGTYQSEKGKLIEEQSSPSSTQFTRLNLVNFLYLLTGDRASGERQHSSTTCLEGTSQETSHAGRDATLIRVLLSQLGKEQL